MAEIGRDEQTARRESGNSMSTKAEWTKRALSLLSGLLPVGERYANVLQLDPAVRNEVFLISVVAAVLAGFGGHESARHLRRGALFGWLGVAGFLGCTFFVIALNNGVSLGLSTQNVGIFLRIIYILIFFFVGLSMGAFLALTQPKSGYRDSIGFSRKT
jgi:hypothetical protein